MLIVGVLSPDGTAWWDPDKGKWRRYWLLPRSYLVIILPLLLLILVVAVAAIWLAVRSGPVRALPDAILGLAATALGGVIGLLVPSPSQAQR